ncbi:hypothetical protein DICA1_C06920 [Diutina catenulata]
MARPRKVKCTSCRRLRIECDSGNPCEYCAATGRKCEYAQVANWIAYEPRSDSESSRSPEADLSLSTASSFLARRLNSPTVLTGVTPFELEIFDFYTVWWSRKYSSSVLKIPAVRAFRQLTHTLFFTSEFVRNGMLTYMSLQFLHTRAPEYLDQELAVVPFDNSSCSKAYHQMSTLFSHQCQTVNSLVAKMTSGNCSQQEASHLMFACLHMYSTTVLHPHRVTPLVDFEHCKFDHLGMVRGLNVIRDMAMPFLAPEDRLVWKKMEEAEQELIDIPIHLPFLQSILRHVFRYGDNAMDWERIVWRMNTTLEMACRARGDLQFHMLLFNSGDLFHELIYQKNPVALCILNIYTAYMLMFEMYIDPARNIWRDFMAWYAEYTEGVWFAPWESALYELVMQKMYVFPSFDVVREFTPESYNALTPSP